jgi:dTDP-4-amino-4,6-dideoxygalactose transaminase
MSGKLAIHGGTPVRDVRKKPWPGWPQFDEKEQEAVARVAQSGRWQADREVREFEERFAEYQDAKYGICVTNGTATMEIALRAFGIGAGDEVIVPTHTFISTALTPLMVNAVPVFADIGPENQNIDPDDVERKITDRTRAIIPVYVWGIPADLDRIMEIAKKHDLRVLEDAAHAHGSEWRGRRIGAIGNMGSFSFQSEKCMVSGDGGILVTDDEELAQRCRSIRQFGGYGATCIGSNYRMTEFQAAILNVQMGRLDDQISLRRENADVLSSGIAEIEGIKPLELDERITHWSVYRYGLRYDSDAFMGVDKMRFAEALEAECGVRPGGVYEPLQRCPVFAERKFGPLERILSCKEYGGPVDYKNVRCPRSEQPHPWFGIDHAVLMGTKEDMDDVIAAMRKIKEHVRELVEWAGKTEEE